MADVAQDSIDAIRETGHDLRRGLPEQLRGPALRENRPRKDDLHIDRAESLVTLAAAVGASLLARRVLQSGWRASLRREPPKNPASTQVGWKEALAWGAISGALIGVVRIASRRTASGAYRKARNR